MESTPSWFPEKSDLTLLDGEVQIWCIWLDHFTGEIPRLAEVFSEDERNRAASYQFEQHKQNFIIRRGVLRFLLSLYLCVQPQDVRFDYGRYGKPSLNSNSHPGEALRFNHAHSEEISLYAFVRNSEVGIDVEHVGRLPEMMAIAKRYFSRREYENLFSLPKEQRVSAFYNCWTRKEAYVKAVGQGLSLKLDSFSVSLASGQPANLVAVEGEREDLSRWTLKSWEPAPGHVAALAVDRPMAEFTIHWLPATA